MPVVLRIEVGRRWIRPHFPQAEPLAGEVLHEGLGLEIGQHPVDLFLPCFGIGELASVGELPQFGVGLARPEKI